MAEIQTPSDTTFRLYDWVDEYARPPRPLHVMQALEATHVDSRPAPVAASRGGSRSLITTPYYRVEEHHRSRGELEGGQLTIVMVTHGTAGVDGTNLTAGSTLIVPASAEPVSVDVSNARVLIVVPVAGMAGAPGTYDRLA